MNDLTTRQEKMPLEDKILHSLATHHADDEDEDFGDRMETEDLEEEEVVDIPEQEVVVISYYVIIDFLRC
ncbi:hypothetical protein HK101_011848 [Irineochytrium annulatum]|nr:hypothetical protein HK101_011848 [Irineochytrium annulatum]